VNRANRGVEFSVKLGGAGLKPHEDERASMVGSVRCCSTQGSSSAWGLWPAVDLGTTRSWAFRNKTQPPRRANNSEIFHSSKPACLGSAVPL